MICHVKPNPLYDCYNLFLMEPFKYPSLALILVQKGAQD